MAKRRYFGAGAILEVETDLGSGVFFRLGLLTNYQLVPDSKPAVDLTGLEDKAYVGGLGISEQSELNFEHIWDGNDALVPADDEADALLDAYHENAKSVQWRVVETDGEATLTETIYGRVRSLTPTQVDGTSGKRRQVIVLRDGTKTRTRVQTLPTP